MQSDQITNQNKTLEKLAEENNKLDVKSESFNMRLTDQAKRLEERIKRATDNSY